MKRSLVALTAILILIGLFLAGGGTGFRIQFPGSPFALIQSTMYFSILGLKVRI
jgi:glucose dehydrogenase